MSVLIKGMEMPADEVGVFKVCVLYRNNDRKLYATIDGVRYEAEYVPPHGRLIDADELESVISALVSAPTIIEAEEG